MQISPFYQLNPTIPTPVANIPPSTLLIWGQIDPLWLQSISDPTLGWIHPRWWALAAPSYQAGAPNWYQLSPFDRWRLSGLMHRAASLPVRSLESSRPPLFKWVCANLQGLPKGNPPAWPKPRLCPMPGPPTCSDQPLQIGPNPRPKWLIEVLGPERMARTRY